ncbi:MAG TPA: isoprenylcysteine carboxylmethyltransferase family protein [Alphaproteobacteria bacterium]|nr:isoprenylcysteine carboxylmethyltransferase family protein [Alphaproteobacteria bacterium]
MTDTEPQRPDVGKDNHAGVRLPPPALFLGALIIGIVLEWLWPLGWFEGLGDPLHYGLGGVLVVAGVVLLISAMIEFRRAGTAIPPWEPATALVTTGAYRFSRNPIYLAMTAICLGLALLFAASWALVLLIPTLAALHVWVIRREEAYLDRRFGEAYRQYRTRVRRWV